MNRKTCCDCAMNSDNACVLLTCEQKHTQGCFISKNSKTLIKQALKILNEEFSKTELPLFENIVRLRELLSECVATEAQCHTETKTTQRFSCTAITRL